MKAEKALAGGLRSESAQFYLRWGSDRGVRTGPVGQGRSLQHGGLLQKSLVTGTSTASLHVLLGFRHFKGSDSTSPCRLRGSLAPQGSSKPPLLKNLVGFWKERGSQTEARTVLLAKPQWDFGSSLCLSRVVFPHLQKRDEAQ